MSEGLSISKLRAFHVLLQGSLNQAFEKLIDVAMLWSLSFLELERLLIP